MELNDTKLNYIYSEADSDDSSNRSDEDFVIKKGYFKQFSIVRTSEGFSIRDILHSKAHTVESV